MRTTVQFSLCELHGRHLILTTTKPQEVGCIAIIVLILCRRKQSINQSITRVLCFLTPCMLIQEPSHAKDTKGEPGGQQEVKSSLTKKLDLLYICLSSTRCCLVLLFPSTSRHLSTTN